MDSAPPRSPLPTVGGHGGDQGSHGVGGANVGASPHGLPYPWKPVG
jgi:hypothetical protein